MAITQNSDRQYPLSAYVEFSYADFVSGVYAAAVDMPADAIVVGGDFVITTAFNSATSDTFTVGDDTDDDEYGAAINGQTAARTALVPTGFQFAQNGTVGLKWTGAGAAPSAGAGFLHVQYVREGRSNENQG